MSRPIYHIVWKTWNKTENKIVLIVQDISQKYTTLHFRNMGTVINIHWPTKITNKKLHGITGTKPLSITITVKKSVEITWVYTYILRKSADCPTRKAILIITNLMLKQRKETRSKQH